MPKGWETVMITDKKKPTAYDLVDDGGTVVLHARADSAATGLGSSVDLDVSKAPVLAWRWKVAGLIKDADNRVAALEDSPARIVFDFEGDHSKLSIADRAVDLAAKGLSGRELPYATLMYIWSNTEPVGMVIPNPRTKRVQMVVASSGAAGVGQWQTLRRNVYEDYKRAFGEAPGMLRHVGVLTDTDNTGGKAEAWYGDLRFLPAGP